MNAILRAVDGVYAAGGAFGCAFNVRSSEYFGRKKSTTSIVGAAIITGPVNVATSIVSRFIMGLGIGVLVTLVPLYQSKVSTRILGPDCRPSRRADRFLVLFNWLHYLRLLLCPYG